MVPDSRTPGSCSDHTRPVSLQRTPSQPAQKAVPTQDRMPGAVPAAGGLLMLAFSCCRANRSWELFVCPVTAPSRGSRTATSQAAAHGVCKAEVERRQQCTCVASRAPQDCTRTRHTLLSCRSRKLSARRGLDIDLICPIRPQVLATPKTYLASMPCGCSSSGSNRMSQSVQMMIGQMSTRTSTAQTRPPLKTTQDRCIASYACTTCIACAAPQSCHHGTQNCAPRQPMRPVPPQGWGCGL